jgi:hypothetical protein
MRDNLRRGFASHNRHLPGAILAYMSGDNPMHRLNLPSVADLVLRGMRHTRIGVKESERSSTIGSP